MQIDLTLSVGQLLAVSLTCLLALLGGVWGLVKLVATQFAMRMEIKFEALSKEVAARDGRIETLERDTRDLERALGRLELKLAHEYMTQDQKVALETTLVGRMDGLANQFEKLINVARN